MATKVVYADGYRTPRGITAEVVHEELLKLKPPGQGVDPEDVVDAAKDPSHRLHDAFEWADDVAAHQYRLDQARYLIRSIRIVFDAAEPMEFRAFVNLEDDGGYHTAAEVGADETLRLKAIQLAQRDVDSAQARLRQFEDLGGIRQLLRQAQDALSDKRSRRKD
jgi:hypothetical protein